MENGAEARWKDVINLNSINHICSTLRSNLCFKYKLFKGYSLGSINLSSYQCQCCIYFYLSQVKKNKKESFPSGNFCANCLASDESEIAPKLSACKRCGLVMYCSRDCQRAHWKASHKQYCIARADRVPQQQGSSHVQTNAASSTSAEEVDCAICLDPLNDASAATLPCTHMFHEACVAELQRFGVQQVCPLCRSPLSPELEFHFIEIAHRYISLQRMVERGDASWSALPTWAQHEMSEVVTELRAVASKDFMHAYQFLAWLYESGRGVAQSDVEAARWYTKAA